VTIPTENPWNSSPSERPREPRETVKAGQRRKCHIIDLLECSSIAGCHVDRLGSSCTNPAGEDFSHRAINSHPHAHARPWAWHPAERLRIAKAGQCRKCNRIDLSECPSVAEAGQRRKCNRIDLSECPGVAQAGQLRRSAREDHPIFVWGAGRHRGGYPQWRPELDDQQRGVFVRLPVP
jgi:hypothetical protein